MRSITVTTEKELKKAIQEKYDKIIVEGDLAKKVIQAEKIKKLSPAAMGILTTCCAAAVGGTVAAPFTGGASLGVSAVALAPAVVATGLSIPVLTIIVIIGLGLLSTLFDEYTKIRFSLNPPEIIFERKKHG